MSAEGAGEVVGGELRGGGAKVAIVDTPEAVGVGIGHGEVILQVPSPPLHVAEPRQWVRP